MGKIFNLSEAALLVGKTLPTLRSWVHKGMPIVKKGEKLTAWQIDMAELVKWREEQAAAAGGDTDKADTEELRRRKLAAEAEMAEIDLALRRGEALVLLERCRS